MTPARGWTDLVPPAAIGLGLGLAVGTMADEITPWAVAGATLGLLYGLRRSKAANVLAGLAVLALILFIALQPATRDTFERSFAAEMRSVLHNLVGAEEDYYTRHHAYTADLASLDTTGLVLGRVRLTISHADAQGWSATASHVFVTSTCSMFVGIAGSGRDSTAGPTCVYTGKYTQAFTDSRAAGRKRERDSHTPVPRASLPTAPPSCAFDAQNPRSTAAGAVSEPEALGYPINTLDRLQVRALLYRRSYGALDSLLTAYTDSARRDFRLEYRLFDAYDAFAIAADTLGPFLDQWIQQRPASATALLARAAWHTARGVRERGTAWARQLLVDQFARVDAHFRAARADVDAALSHAPCSVVAYHLLMIAAPTDGDTAMSRALLDQALTMQPYSFLLRARHMRNLRPRWGGSSAAMEQFARESDRFAVRNARLEALHGFAAWDSANELRARNVKTLAPPQYERALSFADYWEFHFDRGVFYLHNVDRFADALEELNHALIQRPQGVPILEERAWALYKLGEQAAGAEQARYFTRAGEDVALAVKLDPVAPEVQWTVAYIQKHIPEFVHGGGK